MFFVGRGMGAWSFTAARSTRGAAPGRAASSSSLRRIDAPPWMMPSMVLVWSDAPRAAGMSITRLSSSSRPGRGCPEGRGEKVTSFMFPLAGSKMCQWVPRRRPARLEEALHVARDDFGQGRRIPARAIVLLDEERADAFDEVALLHAGVDQVELQAEALRERQG